MALCNLKGCKDSTTQTRTNTHTQQNTYQKYPISPCEIWDTFGKCSAVCVCVFVRVCVVLSLHPFKLHKPIGGACMRDYKCKLLMKCHRLRHYTLNLRHYTAHWSAVVCPPASVAWL